MATNQSTLIVTDSSCDLSPELYEKYQITALPLSITLDNKTYKDGVDMNPEMIFEHYLQYNTLPKTAAPSIYDFSEAYNSLTSKGYDLVFIGIGDKISSTYSNAYIAAKDFPNVYTIDSGNLSSGVGHLVLFAAELAMEGFSAKEIYERTKEKVPYVDASFVIEKLEFLHKGGRCSSVAFLSANALRIKPCIEVRVGSMGVGKKYRGSLSKCIETYIIDCLKDKDSIDPKRCFITHTIKDRAIIDSAFQIIKKHFTFDEILETKAGSTIASHCGEGTLGILFFRKSPVNIFE